MIVVSSFRLKIALLSGLLTGLLVIGSGYLMWQTASRLNLDRLDGEIVRLGQGNLDRAYDFEHYQRFEGALPYIFGERPLRSILTLVRDQQGRVIFKSRRWPAELDPASFAPLKGPLTAQANLAPPPPQWPPPPPPDEPDPVPAPIRDSDPPLPKTVPFFFTRMVNGQSWRFGEMGNAYHTLVLGVNIGRFNADITRFRNACMLILPAALLMAGLSAWFLAAHALRPIAALAQTAERVTASGLDNRIPAMPRDEEFNRLITIFNEMMDRLENSFRQATRFSADASHELKTPLARLQAELEQAVDSAPAGSPQQKIYGSLLEDICWLKAIVQKLLLFSLADAGQLKLALEPVNLTRLLENIIEDCHAQAPQLTVTHAFEPNLRVSADPVLLEEAFQNLAGNAIKYNRPAGRIHVELVPEGNQVCVRIANTGPGIPPEHRNRIFERFYRADPSRDQCQHGVGLGLSLSREIIRAHGGSLVLETTGADATVFAARLPALPPE